MANRAAFTLDGTPSVGATGRGFDAVAGQVIACQLEDLPALDALSVTFEVQNNAAPEADGPLASKGALQATFTGGVAKKILAAPGDITSLTIPASTNLSTWIVRCTVVTDSGTEYFDRAVAVKRGNVRAFVPYEEDEYDLRGFGDSLTELAQEGVSFLWKDPVRAGTTANLAATRSGNILTANANGVLGAQGGVTLIASDRLLVKDQTLPADNGIYVVTDVGSGGTPYVLTRAGDADANDEFATDMRVPVDEGTEAGVWTLGTSGAIVVNTTALVFYREQSFPAGTAVGQVPVWAGSAWLPASDVFLPAGADRTFGVTAPAAGSGTAGAAGVFTGAVGAAAGGATAGGAGGAGRFRGAAGGAGTGGLAAGAGGHAYLTGGAAGADGGGGGANGGDVVVEGGQASGAGQHGRVVVGASATTRQVDSGSGSTVWTHLGLLAASVALAVGAANVPSTGAVRMAHGSEVTGRNNANLQTRSVAGWGVVAADVVHVGDANEVTRVRGSRLDVYAGATQVAQLGIATSDFLALGDVVAASGVIRVDDSFSIVQHATTPADRNLLSGTGEAWQLGDAAQTSTGTIRGTGVTINGAGNILLDATSTQIRTAASGSAFEIFPGSGEIRWTGTTLSPLISQATHATTPHTFTIQAQNVTTGTGSDLKLQSGTGSVAPGSITWYAGSQLLATMSLVSTYCGITAGTSGGFGFYANNASQTIFFQAAHATGSVQLLTNNVYLGQNAAAQVIQVAQGVTSVTFSQADHATAAHLFTVKAGGVVTGTGSDLYLLSGAGSVAPGRVRIGPPGASDYVMSVGYSGAPTSYGGIYILPASTAPDANNFAFLAGATTTYFNTISATGTIAFNAQNTGVASLIYTGTFQWAIARTPTLNHATPTSNVAPINFTIAPQGAWDNVGCTGANRNPASLVIALSAPVQGSVTEAALYITRGGTTYGRMGPSLSSNAYTTLHLLGSGGTPGATNSILSNGGGYNYLGDTGFISHYRGSSMEMHCTSTYVLQLTSTVIAPQIAAITWVKGVSSPALTHEAADNGVTPTDLTFQAQSAHASSTGGARDGGDILYKTGQTTSGGVASRHKFWSGATSGSLSEFLHLYFDSPTSGSFVHSLANLRLSTTSAGYIQLVPAINGDVMLDPTGTGTVYIRPGGNQIVHVTSSNVAFFGTGSYGGGVNVIFGKDAATEPTSNPSGGGIVWWYGGAFKGRGSSGTITTIAAAEPHCPRCGNDYVFEAKNDARGHHIAICWACFLGEAEAHGLDRSKFAFIDKLGKAAA